MDLQQTKLFSAYNNVIWVKGFGKLKCTHDVQLRLLLNFILIMWNLNHIWFLTPTLPPKLKHPYSLWRYRKQILCIPRLPWQIFSLTHPLYIPSHLNRKWYSVFGCVSFTNTINFLVVNFKNEKKVNIRNK